MKYLFIVLLLCSLPVLGQATFREQLDRFRNDFIKCQSDQRFERLQAYYADGLRLMPEFQKTVIGKKNANLYLQSFAKHFDVIKYERHETEVLDLGEQIAEIGFFIADISPRGQQPLSVRGKYVDVWKKDKAALLLITQAWNFDRSLPWESEFRLDDIPSEDVALHGHVLIKDNITFEITAINNLMENIISQHDGRVWSMIYSDDGSFLYSRTPPVVGRKSIDTFFKEHASGNEIFEKLSITNDRIDDLGKYVVGYGSHIAEIRGDNFSAVFTGKDLAIWRRDPNGSLKMFRHIAMYD